MNEKVKSPAPPYISWKTVCTYIQSLQQALPSRIDTSGMIRLSGGLRGPMLNTLKYLKLIKNDGALEPELRQLVDASFPDKKQVFAQILKTVLEKAYPSLLDEAFDLPNTTPKQFSDGFEKLGVSGETTKKAERFFLDAAKDAGIKISPIVIDARKKGPKSPRQSTPVKGDRKKDSDTPPAYSPPPVQELPKWYETFKPAFDKLPAYDNPHWAMSERTKWITALSGLLDLYITIDKEE